MEPHHSSCMLQLLSRLGVPEERGRQLCSRALYILTDAAMHISQIAVHVTSYSIQHGLREWTSTCSCLAVSHKTSLHL